MSYFSNFRLTGYDLDRTNSQNFKIVTDIFVRTKLIESLKNELFVFYKYDVTDGDTPESLAYKYYGSTSRHWIILFANNIVDPFYDWPLTYENFNNFLIDKYGSIENSKTGIHHYEKIITKTDSVTTTVTVNRYELDYNTYANLASTTTETINLKDGNTVKIVTTKNALTYYDYENELNESKRSIKIIDKSYASQIESELLALVTNS